MERSRQHGGRGLGMPFGRYAKLTRRRPLLPLCLPVSRWKVARPLDPQCVRRFHEPNRQAFSPSGIPCNARRGRPSYLTFQCLSAFMSPASASISKHHHSETTWVLRASCRQLAVLSRADNWFLQSQLTLFSENYESYEKHACRGDYSKSGAMGQIVAGRSLRLVVSGPSSLRQLNPGSTCFVLHSTCIRFSGKSLDNDNQAINSPNSIQIRRGDVAMTPLLFS
jgi:hypothetical protein